MTFNKFCLLCGKAKPTGALYYRKLWTKFGKIETNNSRKMQVGNKDNKYSLNNNNNKPTKLYSPERYCMDNVKKYDYENYLSTLLIPDPTIRRCAFAIRALNVELAQIRDLTSTSTIAKMRLEFWSNVVDEIYKNNKNNQNNQNNNNHHTNEENYEKKFTYKGQPVAYELNCVYKINGKKLSKHWFKKLISARNEVCLSDFPFKSIQDLEQYGESSVSPVYYLLIELMLVKLSLDLSASNRIQLDHIASHVGKAQAITNILRGIPHNSSLKRCYVPSDLLVKHKVSHEDFLRRKQTQQVKDACYDIACMANQHVEKAQQMTKQLKSSNEKLLFLSLVTIKKYLSYLQKYDFNVFEPKLSQRNGMLPLILWWTSQKIKYKIN